MIPVGLNEAKFPKCLGDIDFLLDFKTKILTRSNFKLENVGTLSLWCIRKWLFAGFYHLTVI